MNISILRNKFSDYSELMRLNKPVGTLLLAWYSLWGLWLAGEGQPPAYIVFIFIVGTFLMRSAGCVFNDLADRNFDHAVERTKNRPITSGRMSAKEALYLGIVLLLICFILVCLINWQSILLSVLCAAVAIAYPFCKRFLPTPQAVLGIAFSSAVLVAQTAILKTITMPGVYLFLAGLIWAMIYDTYYALVDRSDDIPLGLKSTAIFAQGKEHLFIASMCALMIFFLILSGNEAHLGRWYFLGVLAAAILMLRDLYITRRLESTHCFKAFHNNNWIGAAIFAGLVLNYL